MDRQQEAQLFEKLGEIKGKLDAIEQSNVAQWGKMESIDERLRKQEVKTGGIAAFVAAGVTLGIEYIKKGMGS
ncbi:hypothetical protein [Bowmanella dokdonensis]|uniref:Uncharacterized protein n=1 Tax=Bowmanella dokdonensis TaxID=751969 RepID=A0A939DLM2_9ALTE|nr:hypothetical protein [Bowmanella dokdonensis]MBN7824738.1 hypothetical protein [Bowmanella dokdonensis]